MSDSYIRTSYLHLMNHNNTISRSELIDIQNLLHSSKKHIDAYLSFTKENFALYVDFENENKFFAKISNIDDFTACNDIFCTLIPIDNKYFHAKICIDKNFNGTIQFEEDSNCNMCNEKKFANLYYHRNQKDIKLLKNFFINNRDDKVKYFRAEKMFKYEYNKIGDVYKGFKKYLQVVKLHDHLSYEVSIENNNILFEKVKNQDSNGKKNRFLIIFLIKINFFLQNYRLNINFSAKKNNELLSF